MQLSKKVLISLFYLNSLIFILNKVTIANENNSYSIISDSQSQNENGKFEATGNVLINDNSNFSARSDKAIYEKNKSKIHLEGNVNIKNYQSNDIFIESLQSDELIFFTDKGGFKINAKNGKRVKTKLRF